MYVTGAEVQLFSDLAVGNIKSHQVQAGNPNLERLVMTGENGVRAVLIVGLHRVMPVLPDMARITERTMHYPVSSAVLTDHFEAACVADKL